VKFDPAIRSSDVQADDYIADWGGGMEASTCYLLEFGKQECHRQQFDNN